VCELRTEPSDWLGLDQSTRKKKYLRWGADIVKQLEVALQPEYVVLGEANAEFRETLSAMSCFGDSSNAFRGGLAFEESKPLQAVSV